jgi:hypothetical protein
MSASHRNTKWLSLAGAGLSMVLTVAVPLLVERWTAPSRWLQEEARLCSHVRSRVAQNIATELGRQAAEGGRADVGRALRDVSERGGRSSLTCPVSGERYRVLPDASRWLSAQPTTVAVVCECERHPHSAARATSVYGFDVALPREARMPWENRAAQFAVSAAEQPYRLERVGFIDP